MTYMILGPLVGLVTGAAGVLFLKWRTRVELDAKKETQQIDAQGIPLKLLQDELGKRERELADVRAQDRAERQQYISTLTAMEASLKEMAADIKASREEARDNAHHVHERMDVLDDRLLVIETQLGVKKSA
jgi:cell division septum initiation protein DivIVA